MAGGRQSVVCVSAHTGQGVDELLNVIEEQLKASMEFVHLLIPFSKASSLWNVLLWRANASCRIGNIIHGSVCFHLQHHPCNV